MNAQSPFASRFTEPADPMDMLRLLQGMAAQDALADSAFADALGSESNAEESDESAPPPEKPEAPSAVPKSGRESNGRFAKGNPGGPGNPFNRQVARLRQQLIDSMTPAVFQQAIAALVVKACSGDTACLKLLFQYTLGKPAEAVHPDRVAIDEANLQRESTACGKALPDMTGTPVLEFLMLLIRELQFVCTEKWKKRLFDRVDAVNDAKEKAAAQKEARRARQEARRAQAAAMNSENAAGQSAPDAAGRPHESKVAPPSASGSGGAAANDVATGSGEPGALATGVHPAAADASSGRSRSRLSQPAVPAAAPSPNRPDGASVTAQPTDSDASKTPIDHVAAPPDSANRGKTKAPPSANGTDRPPAATPLDTVGVRPTQAA